MGTGGASGSPSLASLVQAKAAVHGGGLVGGLALKVAKPDGLRRVLAKPDGRPRSLKAVLAVAGKALDDAGITYGIMDDALRDMVMELLDKVAQGEPAAIARKVAEGEEPQPGQDGYVEYPLNHNSRPYHVLADLPATSGRKRCTVVHAQEVLATAPPPTAPSFGTGRESGERRRCGATRLSGGGGRRQHRGLEGKGGRRLRWAV